MKTLLLGLAVLTFVPNAHASERFAESQEIEPSIDSPLTIPAKISDIRDCFDSERYLAHFQTPDATPVVWKKPATEHRAVAASAVVPKGPRGEPGPGLITVTENKLYYNKLNTYERPREYGTYTSADVTLNLFNKFDPKWGLPIVDPKEDAGFFERLTLYDSNFKKYNGDIEFRPLAPNHVEINSEAEIYGDAAVWAKSSLIESLREGIRNAPERLADIYSKNGDFIASRGMERTRKTLCDCQAIAPKEIQKMRKTLLEPSYPIRVREENGSLRRIEANDLMCNQLSS